MALIVLNSILLICADLVLAVALSQNISLGKKIRRLKDIFGNIPESRIMRNAGIKDFRNPGGKRNSILTLMEKLELTFIEKSNIRHYIPFMNIYLLLSIIFALFISVFRPVNNILRFPPSSIIISGIISVIPLFLLDMLARRNGEAVRKRLAEYVSVLSRWCSVKEDIMYAFEKSLESSIEEPLQTFIRDMVIQVNRGMDAQEALDILQKKVDSSLFRDFIVNIKLSLRHRGNITKLLANLENQFYCIDEEYNRRKISTYKDRLLVYVVMLGVLATGYLFINLTSAAGDFYLGTANGKLLLGVFCGMYGVGFYLTMGITRFR